MNAKHASREREREAPEVPAPPGPSEELEALRLERDEQIAAHQRTAADFANFRRRTAEEREREAGLASEALLFKVLAIADEPTAGTVAFTTFVMFQFFNILIHVNKALVVAYFGKSVLL